MRRHQPTPVTFDKLDVLNTATRYVVVVKYPSGDERFMSQAGGLTSDVNLARRYKRESAAKAEARTMGAVVRMVVS